MQSRKTTIAIVQTIHLFLFTPAIMQQGNTNTYHGQHDHGIPCPSYPCRNHHNYDHIWPLNVLREIWQICFCGRLLHNKKWVPCHTSIGIFDMHETLELPWFPIERSTHPLWLVWQGYAYIKNKGANLNAHTNVLTNIVSCVLLMLLQLYASNCYAHVMSKC